MFQGYIPQALDTSDPDVKASDMQAALTWAGVYAQTTDPGVAGKPWNNAGHLVFSAGASLGLGSMSIGSTFIVG